MRFRLRLYLETTTFNYFFDETRPGHDDVVKLFEAIKAGEFIGYTSQYVNDELEDAPEPKRSKMLSLVDDYGLEVFEYDDEATALAESYIDAGIISSTHFYDSLHVAITTVQKLSAIVSYNFHHINRNKTTVGASLFNLTRGYKPVVICTAEEVLKYGNRDYRGDGSD